MLNPFITNIAERVLNAPGQAASFEEACKLALLSEAHPLDLMVCADKIRNKYKKNRIFTCAIINAKSGLCSQDCAFCAQSAHHRTQVQTYPLMTADQIVSHALHMAEAGATKYAMVTSGYALSSDEIETVSRAATRLKRHTKLDLCASLGMITASMATRLKDSGITRYHHNLETGRSHFHQVCTSHDYAEDLQTVRMAKSAGLEVCSGGIMGLGESWEQRVELAFTLRELDVDAIPINFLNPIPGTKMAHSPRLAPMEALRCIALFRFIHPQKEITICGGRDITLQDYQSWVFMAGANGLMVGDYLTTKGRSTRMDMEMIKAMGLTQ